MTEKLLIIERVEFDEYKWERSFDSFNKKEYNDEDVRVLVQSGLDMFESLSNTEEALEMLSLLNKARIEGEHITKEESERIQDYYSKLSDENFHTEVLATEIYTKIEIK